MEIIPRLKDEIPFLALGGDIVDGNEETLSQVFNELIQAGRFNVVLDLARTTSIDRSALGAIVGGYSALRMHNGTLKMLNPTKTVRSSLREAGLSRFFEIFEDELEAILSFSS